MKKHLLISIFFLVLATGFVAVAYAQPAGAVPPTVSITSPSAGSPLWGKATLSATASGSSGTVKVEFFDGNTSIGIASSKAPYLLLWDTSKTANGIHILTADATDAAGNKTTSAPVGVFTRNPGQAGNNKEDEAGGKTMVSIGPDGEALVRGIVTANSDGALSVSAWGITFTVNTNAGTRLSGVADVASLHAGDFIGVRGILDPSTSSPVIIADALRERKAFTMHRDNISEKNRGHENEWEGSSAGSTGGQVQAQQSPGH